MLFDDDIILIVETRGVSSK